MKQPYVLAETTAIKPDLEPIGRVDVSTGLADAPEAIISNGQVEAKVLLPDAQTGFAAPDLTGRA